MYLKHTINCPWYFIIELISRCLTAVYTAEIDDVQAPDEVWIGCKINKNKLFEDVLGSSDASINER